MNIYGYALGALLGVAAHLGIFIRGEWHLRAPAVAQVHTLALATLPAVYAGVSKVPYEAAYSRGLQLFFVYVLSLLASITVYRRFFHRLRHFPGPRLAATSKLWHVVQNRDSKNHLVLDRLYKKYGTFVRTGPEELTIFHASAQEALDGSQNLNTRSDWYDIVHPRVSPIFSRTNEDHRDRRAIWNHALSVKATKEYIPDIVQQVHTLKTAIATYGSGPVPIGQLMQMYAYDSMGHFAFDQDFKQLETRKMHEAAVQQRTALTLLGPFNPVPWAITIALRWFPQTWKIKDWNGMVRFCDLNVKKRLESTSDHPDVSAWLVQEYKEGLNDKVAAQKMNLLSGNAVALMIGASDTSASAFTVLAYYLAKYPQYADSIALELSSIDITNPDVLAMQPQLNGFINESMRLLPAALTFGTRETPKQGMFIEDVFIPGKVKINTSRYTVSRMEHIYEKATEFIPERWFSKPEMIKDKSAYAPFGTGRRQCVGKNLAMSQTRILIAHLVSGYHVDFAPGTDVDSIERDMQDQLTAQLGEFSVVFRER